MVITYILIRFQFQNLSRISLTTFVSLRRILKQIIARSDPLLWRLRVSNKS